MPCSAPMSDHVTSGTVANPSRFEEGWTSESAARKSEDVMHRGASWDSVNGDGWADKKCAMELEESWSMSDANGRIGYEGGGASAVGV